VEVTSIRLFLLSTELTKLLVVDCYNYHWCCASFIIAYLKPAIPIRDTNLLEHTVVQTLGFSAPVRSRGHFEEISIAKVLLGND